MANDHERSLALDEGTNPFGLAGARRCAQPACVGNNAQRESSVIEWRVDIGAERRPPQQRPACCGRVPLEEQLRSQSTALCPSRCVIALAESGRAGHSRPSGEATISASLPPALTQGEGSASPPLPHPLSSAKRRFRAAQSAATLRPI
jgi:hypothetical protein